MKFTFPDIRKRTKNDGAADTEATPSVTVSRQPVSARSVGFARRGTASRAGVGTQRTIFPRRRRPHVVVRRSVLLAVLAVGVALVTFAMRSDDAGLLEGPQMFVVEAVSPIERGLTRAWQPFQDVTGWTGRLIGATNENDNLKAQIEELEQQMSIQKDVAAENERLRDLLALRERGRFPNGYHLVSSSVIARPADSAARSMIIDRGLSDGLRVDDPVMASRGLIGRISAVSSNAAQVVLLSNRSQAISAVISGSDATGILRSVGNQAIPVMQLDYVLQSARVATGDLVTTSGWSTDNLKSVFPKGIPIGYVSSVGNSPADLYKTVQVTPFADMNRVDEVLVLRAIRRTSFIPPDTQKRKG